MLIIELERFSYGPSDISHPLAGTFGQLTIPDMDRAIYTVERPWVGNTPFESCIPEGVYRLSKRESPVVTRTTNGEYNVGWEVTDVENREHIMFHPANWPSDVEGCIGVGFDYNYLSRLAVIQSRKAFKCMMNIMSEEEYELHVFSRPFSYP